MNPFPVHSLETAPPESRPLVVSVEARFGFLPNVYAQLAEAPAVLDALLQLSAIFNRTTLTERHRHLLLLTSSVENECTFCVAAHTLGARAGGVSQDAIASIRDGLVPNGAEDAAMVSFVRAMIRSRGFVSDEELNLFFQRGFTPRNALEVVLGVTLKILTNCGGAIRHLDKSDHRAVPGGAGGVSAAFNLVRHACAPRRPSVRAPRAVPPTLRGSYRDLAGGSFG
jgi:AhpD family alkylhydroperoxidase